jgi:hypothetical protein
MLTGTPKFEIRAPSPLVEKGGLAALGEGGPDAPVGAALGLQFADPRPVYRSRRRRRIVRRASGWNGISAPRNTPAEIVDKINMKIAYVLNLRRYSVAATWSITALMMRSIGLRSE